MNRNDLNKMNDKRLSVKGVVFDIQKFSLHDGPGIRTTVFIKGCPLKCPWCSNPESQTLQPVLMHEKKTCIKCGICSTVCPRKAIDFIKGSYPKINYGLCDLAGTCVEKCPTNSLKIKGKVMTVREVIVEVEKDLVFYRNNGGMTLSGGEILFQPDFSENLISFAKSRGIHTAVETSGYAQAGIFKKVIKEVDLVLFDFKHSDPDIHEKTIGVDNKIILENLQWLVDQKKEVIVRIPIIPDFNFDEKTINDMAGILSSMGITDVDLLPFHQLGERKYDLLNYEYGYKGVAGLNNEDLVHLKSIMESYDIKTQIGG